MVRTLGRSDIWLLDFAKRKLRRGTAWAEVLAVMKRIFPFMQSYKFPGLSLFLAVLMMSIDKGVIEAHNHDSIMEASEVH